MYENYNEHNTDRIWADDGLIRGCSPKICSVSARARMASVNEISEKALEWLCDVEIDSTKFWKYSWVRYFSLFTVQFGSRRVQEDYHNHMTIHTRF